MRYAPSTALSAACQVSRNLYQYFGASCEIAEYYPPGKPEWGPSDSGNVISILQGFTAISRSTPAHFPITISHRGIEITRLRGSDTSSTTSRVYAAEPGLGAVFLIPAPNEALELRVWGCDEEGLRQALRLIPTMTGVGQPDFVVMSAQCRSQGAAGVFAMGFFDSRWNVSLASYLS